MDEQERARLADALGDVISEHGRWTFDSARSSPHDDQFFADLMAVVAPAEEPASAIGAGEMAAFLRARLNEDHFAAVLFSGDPHWSAEVKGSLYDRSPADPAIRHIARYDPARALSEAAVGYRLLEAWEQLLRAKAAHDVAVAEYSADVDRENITGIIDQERDLGTRGRSITREADYLDAMLPVIGALVKLKVAVWSDHPDYKESWKP